MHNFKELKIWTKSIDLTVEIYKLTDTFPGSEKFGLVSQIRRSSVSIASNIAEGASRVSNKDFARFLQIALGSAFELETQLMISKEVLEIDTKRIGILTKKIIEIQKMINGFRISIQSKLN